MEYATYEARLASYAPPTKRSKAGWPLKSPTPEDLARAGFFWKPGKDKDSKDNVQCFMCERHIGGWDQDDDALQEHLTHGSDCAWAVLQSLDVTTEFNAANMDDPTDTQLHDARKQTFTTIGWPHESKKGWTCKTDKMAEAGWYFDPSLESEDYVKCVYCKLSLDGWEPKDNPFEEHHRRSPDCPFFVFAGTTAPSKRPKAKKARTSKASRTSRASTRLSTQSDINNTLLSNNESIPDLDQSLDGSNISLMSTASTATKQSKRKATTKSKATKSKKAKTAQVKSNAEDEMDVLAGPTSEPNTRRAPQTSQPDPSLEAQETEKVSDTNAALTEEPAVADSELGPPPKEDSPIPAKQPSPLKAVAAPASQPTPIRNTQTLKRKSNTQTQPRSPSQPSDVENDPPSSRPKSVRPLLSSPSALQPNWRPVDIESIFGTTPNRESMASSHPQNLTGQEKEMTVQEWIDHIAERAEKQLRDEGERVVGVFEREGQKALGVLEGIVCA